MVCEGHFSVEVEVEAPSSGAATEGPAAAPPARRSGIRVVVTCVGGRHCVVSVGIMSRIFEYVSYWSRGTKGFVMGVVVVSIYMLFVTVCGAVRVVNRSRVDWCRGVTGIRSGFFLEGFR